MCHRRHLCRRRRHRRYPRRGRRCRRRRRSLREVRRCHPGIGMYTSGRSRGPSRPSPISQPPGPMIGLKLPKIPEGRRRCRGQRRRRGRAGAEPIRPPQLAGLNRQSSGPSGTPLGGCQFTSAVVGAGAPGAAASRTPVPTIAAAVTPALSYWRARHPRRARPRACCAWTLVGPPLDACLPLASRAVSRLNKDASNQCFGCPTCQPNCVTWG